MAELRLRKPSNGLSLAMDPRIPDEHEYFEFKVTDRKDIAGVRWFVNGELVATTKSQRYDWKLSRGKFSAYAQVQLKNVQRSVATNAVEYHVH